ncbi:hypothetical protein JWZ98_21500 [Methylomonas sp. EFPC1]|uniref:hypothetical protein n=1 Tax=unclassified Methylomonas TaxID=2608980 RepID=UPI001020F8C0|nr:MULTISPECIES: hypothetical protein [unclassified Methylomonas]QSB01180.1 hypothetical protein JWZ98_21500 [Methylomonas sp. EFPC1]
MSTDVTGQVTIDQHPELSYESPSVHLSPTSFAISRPAGDTSSYGGIFDFSIFNVNVLERWLYEVRRQPIFRLSCKGDRLGSMDCLRGYAAAADTDSGHSTFLICSIDMVLNLSRTSVHFQIDGEFGQSLPYTKPLYKELSTFSIVFTIEDDEMLNVCRDRGQRLLDYRNRFVFGGKNAEPSG